MGKPSIDEAPVLEDEPEGRDGEVTGSIRTFARVRESGVLYDDCMVPEQGSLMQERRLRPAQ